MQPIVTTLFAWSPFLQVGVLALGTLVSFLVAYFKHDVSIYLPFISENGATVPEMGVFSSTLIAGSFVGFFTVSYRYLMVIQIHNQQEHVHRKLKLLNHLAVLCGMGSMAGLAGVAAFPMSTVLVVHLLVAGVHFSLAMVYLFMNTYLSYRMQSPDHQPMFMKTRMGLCILLTVFLVLLVIVLPFAYIKWKKVHPNTAKALKTPEDEGFGLVFCSALFEWLLYIAFLAYILTFQAEFRKFQLVIYVESVGSNSQENGSKSNAALKSMQHPS